MRSSGEDLSRPQDGLLFNGKLFSQRILAAKNGHQIDKATLTNIDCGSSFFGRIDDLPFKIFSRIGRRMQQGINAVSSGFTCICLLESKNPRLNFFSGFLM